MDLNPPGSANSGSGQVADGSIVFIDVVISDVSVAFDDGPAIDGVEEVTNAVVFVIDSSFNELAHCEKST